jgi:hypothetical protein
MDIYRKRQAIVEHPFGVIKRQWDFYYIMTKKSMKHASADVGLIFTCYNLRRIFNVIGKNQLKEYLKQLAYMFLILIGYFKFNRRMVGINFFEGTFSKWRHLASLNGLYLGK